MDEDEMVQRGEEEGASDEEKTAGAIKLEAWTRGVLARMLLTRLARDIYEKTYDEKEGKYYYVNMLTFQTMWTKPKTLRAGDALDDLDREAAKLENLSPHERMKAEYILDRKRKKREEVSIEMAYWPTSPPEFFGTNCRPNQISNSWSDIPGIFRP